MFHLICLLFRMLYHYTNGIIEQLVTVQYLHSYDAKSILNRLRRWDFALLNHFLTVSAVNASTCTE